MFKHFKNQFDKIGVVTQEWVDNKLKTQISEDPTLDTSWLRDVKIGEDKMLFMLEDDKHQIPYLKVITIPSSKIQDLANTHSFVSMCNDIPRFKKKYRK